MSATSFSAMRSSPGMNRANTPSASNSCMACTARRWQAMAVSGTFGLGFQITVLPQIAERKAFCAHTAAGKL
ncbi:hypothetical protein D3C81_2191750 [compost metagenome]